MAIIGYGFIGRRVARAAVARGWRVRALNLEEAPGEPVEVVVGSAQDVTALEQVLVGAHHVTYAAGTAKPAESNLDPVGDAIRNLEPLISVLSAARSRRITGFSFLSSGGTVYGPDAPVPTREDAPLWPISSYGIMKIAAERYVAMYARQAGFAADLLRCANVFGPGEPTAGSQGFIGIARANLLAGRPITVFGDGSARRDYIHADDLSEIVVRLASNPTASVSSTSAAARPPRSPRSSTRSAGRTASLPVLDRRHARASDSPIAQLDVTRLRETPGLPSPAHGRLAGPPSGARDGRGSLTRAPRSSSPRPRRHALRTCRSCAKRSRTSRTGRVVLDVGAGGAPYRELFSAFDYRTTDWSGTSHAPTTPVDYVAPAHDLPLETATVDAVVCTQVLEHIAEPVETLLEFRRVLRPGGRLIVTCR